MAVGHAREVAGKNFEGNGARGVLKKTLIGKEQGWNDYVMRLFELSVGGHSPHHQHPWPHIAFIVEGSGIINIAGTDHLVEKQSYAYIPAGADHQFVNKGDSELLFICIVPPEGDA